MAKYFKLVEIDEEEFINETDEVLDCCQVCIPIREVVFVGIDDEREYEIQIPLDYFD